MGMDFNVDVNVKTNGKSEVDALEKQIQKLQNTKINLNVSMNGNGADITSLFSGIEKQAKVAGKSIKTALQTQIETVAKTQRNAFSQPLNNITKQQQSYIDSFDKQLKQREKVVSQINSKISNKSYDVAISSFSTDLNKYSKNAAQYKDVENSINDLSNAYKQLQAASEAYEKVGSNANYDALIKAQDNLNIAMQRTRNEMKMLGNDQNKLLDASTIASTKKSFASYLDNNSKAVRAYKEEIAQLEKQLENMTTVADKANFDIGVNNLKTKAIKEGNTGKSWLQELGRSMKQIGEFAGVYNVIRNVTFEIPEKMVQAVKDVNAAQIELIKVSDASSNQLSQYWDEASESAQKYGASISDVISSTADWSRLGYNLEDAKKLSDATTLLQKVGDNMTQESSSQGLISTLRGFSMQADEVNKIVDIANQIANTQPIDTTGLFKGLENSASSLSAANNSFEQSISLITAANSVLQDPSSVGTALKTISMRVRGASTELEQAGLDADGMAESVAKLREEIKALSGVDIMQDENTFKSTYDILDELSTKWKDLTDIQRASVTELIAGKRNGNVVSSLMQNFDIARETLNTALNESEGSAEKELANYQKGIEYSFDKLQAAFQKFSNITINSDFLKGIVDTGTGALDVITQLTDQLGTLGMIASGIGIFQGFTNGGKSIYGIRPYTFFKMTYAT